MTDLSTAEYNRTALLGAIIGLSRAVKEGNGQITPATHETILSGLLMCIPGTDCTKEALAEQIESLHIEKKNLISNPSDNENAGDRFVDYDLTSISDPEEQGLKYTLLSSLMSLIPFFSGDNAKQPDQQVMDLLYNALFVLSTSCTEEDIYQWIMEAGNIYQELFQAHFTDEK